MLFCFLARRLPEAKFKLLRLLFQRYTRGWGKALEARAVSSWKPPSGTTHTPALNAMPCSLCVLSKKLETEWWCLIWSCPQQFWKVLTMNAKSCYCHAASCPRFLSLTQELHHRKDIPVRGSLAWSGKGILLDVIWLWATARIISLPSGAAWVTLACPKLRNFYIWLWPWGDTLPVWLFQPFILLSLTSSLLVWFGETHFLSISL